MGFESRHAGESPGQEDLALALAREHRLEIERSREVLRRAEQAAAEDPQARSVRQWFAHLVEDELRATAGRRTEVARAAPGRRTLVMQQAEPDDAPRIEAPRRESTRLDVALQWRMSQAFGFDFSGVSIRPDSPDATGATRALVKDGEVHFREGAFQPGTRDGDWLIAHELAHVVQQRGGRGERAGSRKEIEREADRAATMVALGRAAPIALRAQPAVAYAFDEGEHRDDAVDAAVRPSGGDPLPPALRAILERRFGVGLGGVRLHRDAAAEAAASAVGARAFTVGEHVFFGSRQPGIDTREGIELLAHELTHVVQFYQGRVRPSSGLEVSDPDDALEREADTIGPRIAADVAPVVLGEGASAAPRDPALARMGTSTERVGRERERQEPAVLPADAARAPASTAAALPALRDPAPGAARTDARQPLAGAPPDPDRLIGSPPQRRQAPPRAEGAADAARIPSAGPGAGRAPAGAPAKRGGTPAKPPPKAPGAAPHGGPGKEPHPAAAARPADRGTARAAPPVNPATHAPRPTLPEGGAPLPGGPAPGAMSPAERAAAAQLATQAGAQLAAQAQAQAASIRVAGEASRAALAAAATQHEDRVRVSGTQARARAEQAFTSARTAIEARRLAERAVVGADRTAQLAAITAAGQAQRARIAAAVAERRTTAASTARQTRASLLQLGEAQAQRATRESEVRAARAEALAGQAGAGGDPERAGAQRESAQRIAARAAEGCRSTGADMAQAARESARCYAEQVDGKLAEYTSGLDGSTAQVTGHFDEMAASARAQIDGVAAESERGIDAVARESQAALDRQKQEALARIERMVGDSVAAIGAALQGVLAELAPRVSQIAEQVVAAGQSAQAQVAGLGGQGRAAIAATAEAARAELDLVHTRALDGVRQLETTTGGELGGIEQTTVQRVGEATDAAGTDATSAGQAAGERVAQTSAGARASMTQSAGTAVRTMAGAGDELVARLDGAAHDFAGALAGLVGEATPVIGGKVDEGLAKQDAWVAKAQGEIGTTSRHIGAEYDSLRAQAERQSAAGVQRNWLGDAWRSVSGFVGGLVQSVRQWFIRTFGERWGGFLFGVLQGLVIIALAAVAVWAIGAIVGAIIVSAKVAAIVTACIVVAIAVPLAIYARFQEFYADNPGQDAGFWRGLALVGLGIADLTGIPYIVEGIVGQRAFGRQMSLSESWERIGMGVVFLGAAIFSGIRFLRGRSGGAPRSGDGTPVDGQTPREGQGQTPREGQGQTPREGEGQTPREGEGQTPREGEGQTPREGEGQVDGENGQEPPAPTRELGLREDAVRAIERLENLKRDPVGDVNSQPNHNHYSAARREAAGEVVARRPDGRPYSHIGDLQRACDGLDNVRTALEREIRSPPETITPRGREVLARRYSEVQALLSRLRGFLGSIGHGRFPPYHQWPPGS